MKYIFSEFLDNFLNWDSKFFTTLRYLILKPGFLSKEYIEGKRMSYVAPIRFYIVISVIFFFVVSIFADFNSGNKTSDNSGITVSYGDATVNLSADELKQMNCEGTLENYIDSITVNSNSVTKYLTRKTIQTKVSDTSFFSVIINQLSLFLLLFVPLLALLYASCFSQNKLGFISHLIFNFHVNSFVIFLLIFTWLIGVFVTTETQLYWLIGTTLLITQFYLLKAVSVFYQRRWFIVAYKYLFLLLGYAVLGFVFWVFVLLTSLVIA